MVLETVVRRAQPGPEALGGFGSFRTHNANAVKGYRGVKFFLCCTRFFSLSANHQHFVKSI